MAGIDSKYYLNQTDYSDIYIGDDTIYQSGCGVCCLAMYLLHKSGISTVGDTERRAAINAIINSGFLTGALMYQPPQSHNVNFNSTTYNIAFSRTSDVAQGILDGGIGFMRIYNSSYSGSHFVLVDDFDSSAEILSDDPDGLRRHKVVDPVDGTKKTLYQAIKGCYSRKGYNNISPSTAFLDSNWKCLFG